MLNSLIVSLILVANQQRPLIDALSPPSFVDDLPNTLWFQLSDNLSGRQSKLELPCVAIGDPETFKWKKDGEPFVVDGVHAMWTRPGQAGSIQFNNPGKEDQGFYQCFVSNAFGTAVSNRVQVRLGFLDHFPDRELRIVKAIEGKSVSIECKPPNGVPPPTVDWVIRDKHVESVMESASESQKDRITVDEEGTLHFSYVLRNDTQTTRFFECAVSSPVLRGEYRGGDRIQLSVQPKSPIPRTDPFILHRSAESVIVRAGETLKLSCILGGYPSTSPTWSKYGENLPVDRIRTDRNSGNHFLVIEDIHPEDSGTFQCEFFGEQIHFEVTVKAAPYWESGKPSDVTENEDDDAELHCFASGNPRPLIQWFMNGVPLHELRDNNTRRLILDDGRILRVSDIKRDFDTGVYQCNASNPSGFVFANAFINVLAMAPQFKSPEKKIWRVARYETVDIPCIVEAAPTPSVRWVDANDQPIAFVDGKIELFPDNTLRIYNVDHPDEKIYYCNVSNKYGINRAENSLFVYDQMYFRQVLAPQKLTVEAYESVELKCEAAADPRLQIRYFWTRNGRPFDFIPELDGTTSILRLDTVRGRDSGRIECTAITEIGQKKSEMQLIVKDVPEPPSSVNVACQPKSALISWKSPSEHGSPISEYRIEQKTNFAQNEWTTALIERDLERDEFEAQLTLSPWVNYTFRILAVNSYGESQPGSAHNAHCETAPNVPFTNPKNVRVAGTKPDNLVIRWEPMEKSEWNAPGLRYKVFYRLREAGGRWHEFYVEDPLADHTILRERPTFKEYEVKVQAVNEKGVSSEKPEIVNGFSGEDVPLTPPAHLTLANVDDFDRVTVKWDAVDPETVRGHFRGYKVIYWISENPYFTDTVLVGPQHIQAQLNDLKALTNYTMEVRVVNEAYESPSSLTISFTTPEGRPSEVTQLKVVPVGSNSMLATWEPPVEPNGHIRGYYVRFENSSSPDQITESYVLANQHFYLSEQLQADSSYRFEVWAETNGGEGAKRSAVFQTFPLKNPDVPRFAVLPHKSRSFLIRWQAIDASTYPMPGTTFYVQYALVGSEQWNRTEEIALPKRELLLEDLRADTDYWIIGVARENDRRTHSARYKVHTGGGLSLSHINAENLREAAWFIAILFVVGVILLILAGCCCIAQCRSGKYSVQKREQEFGKVDDPEEYKKFLEYHHLHDRDDPPTISVSLAESTIDSRKRPSTDIEDQRNKSDSPIHYAETAQLWPKRPI
ncbi:hypothetical protein M3Y95_00766900 [Aphelenchoides besseyi]|nr:hypothetical protein M3Y95_00766900 [Aphelenchoides besseyi]